MTDVRELVWRPGMYDVTITPEDAASLLELNTRNRHHKSRAMQDYARQMREGKWRFTNQGLGIDRNGVVVDGQNRLMAIIEAGVPIRTLLVTGLDPEAWDVVDVGVKRSFGDVLRRNGYKNVSNLAGAVSLRARYENAADRGWTWVNARGRGQRFTHVELEEFLDKHPSLSDRTPGAWLVRTALGHVGLSTIVAFESMAVETDPAALAQFREAMISGALLTERDPRLLLRNTMMRQERAPDSLWSIGLWVKAWNLWRAGETRDLLSLKETEKMPRFDARPAD